MDPEARIRGSGGWDHGSGGSDPWIRRLGSMDPEARIHGSGGWHPWIRRLGSMDPEAGTHGSGGWDPWIRASEAGLGRPRPAGRGEGARSAKRAKKCEKSCKWRHLTYPRPDAYTAPALGTLFGARSAHLREKCVLRTFPTFSHFWSISTRENISPNGHFHFGAKKSEK